MNEDPDGELGSLKEVDAVVTGASRGLGFACAKVLAAAGARVWMVDEVAEDLHEAVSAVVSIGGKVEFRVVDLADPAEVSELVVDVRSKTPRLEVLVNGAVTPERASTGEHGEQDTRTMLVRGLLPGLRRAGGSIVNVSSNSAGEGAAWDLAVDGAGPTISVNSVRGDGPVESTDLAEGIRFVCSLRGTPSGRHLDLVDVTRQLATEGPEAVLSRFQAEAEA